MMGAGGMARRVRDAPLLQMTGVWLPAPTPETIAPCDPIALPASSGTYTHVHIHTQSHIQTQDFKI